MSFGGDCALDILQKQMYAITKQRGQAFGGWYGHQSKHRYRNPRFYTPVGRRSLRVGQKMIDFLNNISFNAGIFLLGFASGLVLVAAWFGSVQ